MKTELGGNSNTGFEGGGTISDQNGINKKTQNTGFLLFLHTTQAHSIYLYSFKLGRPSALLCLVVLFACKTYF